MKEIFTTIYKQNLWGSSESVSGPGSSLTQTKTLIKQLPILLKQLQVKKVLDAPCGDFNWMKEIHQHIESYIGIDIVEDLIDHNKSKYATDHIQFIHSDLTKDALPKVDLILCRDCLVHFCFDDISSAIRNMKASKSKYLLTTTFPNHKQNTDIKTGGWRPLNFEMEPFYFPKPILLIHEFPNKRNRAYTDKSLGLWELDMLDYEQSFQ
jgi:Methyltransferase domain